jgi:hypothetical protein
MSKKFDAEAYVASWDAKVIPAMIAVIVVSLVLVVILNVATRPDCLRHEYVFCGTEAVQAGHHSGAEAHGAKPH